MCYCWCMWLWLRSCGWSRGSVFGFGRPVRPFFCCWDKGLSIPECEVLIWSRLLLLGINASAPFFIEETGAAAILLSSFPLFLSSSSFNAIFNLPLFPSKRPSILRLCCLSRLSCQRYLPFSFSIVCFTCSYARYLMNMMPSAAPLHESICGLKDAMVL